MSDQSDAFVKEGFEAFPSAWEAVTEFTSMIGGRIQEAFAETTEGGFTLNKDETMRPDFGGRPSAGCWVFAGPRGKVGSKPVRLEIGYWWRPPNLGKTALIAYVNEWFDAKQDTPKMSESHKPTASGVELGRVGSRLRLFVRLTPSSAGNEELRNLLVEFGRWFSASAAAAQ